MASPCNCLPLNQYHIKIKTLTTVLNALRTIFIVFKYLFISRLMISLSTVIGTTVSRKNISYRYYQPTRVRRDFFGRNKFEDSRFCELEYYADGFNVVFANSALQMKDKRVVEFNEPY